MTHGEMCRDELRTLGELLCHWHSGQGDPIYAVGSYFFSGKDHPQPPVVFAALSGINRLLRQKQYGLGDEEELRAIIGGLELYIQDRGLIEGEDDGE